jgi:hypothetical protein
MLVAFIASPFTCHPGLEKGLPLPASKKYEKVKFLGAESME